MLFEVLSTLSTGLFAGAAFYISVVEHPARIQCGVDLALQVFRSSYRKGAPFMGSLLLTGLASVIASWLSTSNAWWVIGGVPLLFSLSFTIIFVLPISKKLLDPSLSADHNLASKLLRRWAALHWLRSLMGLTSFLTFLILLVKGAVK